MKDSTRRTFLKAGSLGVTGLVAGPVINQASAIDNSKLPDNLTILFQGDSITDAGRERARYYPNDTHGMGKGYVFQIVTQLLGANPTKVWKYYNRGISGNKVFQLANRWDDDCLNLKPDVLSILIGVNDFWHALQDYDGTVETYEEDFRKPLDRTLKTFPDINLIIGEPFAVKGGSAIDERWSSAFMDYQHAAATIAKDYKAGFIQYQKIFDVALDFAPASYWCPDGVHPSMAGGYLMKEAWIKTFNDMY